MTSLTVRINNRVQRVMRARWRSRPYQSDRRIVVIGGSPRSGTTLLRRLLDQHPAFCCGPESNILLPGAIDVQRLAHGYDVPVDELQRLLEVSPSQGAFVDAFAAACCERRERWRWAEKTPLNIWHAGWVWQRFPEARVIHVIRDGRDVVCSMRAFPDRRWTAQGWVDTYRNVSAREAANRWVTHTGKGLQWRSDPRYREVRYEDLVRDPDGVMAGLLAWIGEAPWTPGQAEADGAVGAGGGAPGTVRPDAAGAVTMTSVGRWQRDLSRADQEIVRRVAGARLVELGYATSDDW